MLHACLNQKGKNANLKKINVLSYGINKYTSDADLVQGPHAEHDAILKLKNHKNTHAYMRNRNRQNKNDKRREAVNILVVRFSKTGKIQNSKPCHNCIQMMMTQPEKMGYKIEDVYYSNNDETITQTSLKELNDEEEHHYTRLSRVKK